MIIGCRQRYGNLRIGGRLRIVVEIDWVLMLSDWFVGVFVVGFDGS